jgi:hypothetical protein
MGVVRPNQTRAPLQQGPLHAALVAHAADDLTLDEFATIAIAHQNNIMQTHFQAHFQAFVQANVQAQLAGALQTNQIIDLTGAAEGDTDSE